ncbi:MAG: bacillithiol biosynthesis cysteine-adding enzyme BshC, partial [Pyrinomonadaceae bacterium]|nr:bacillithiol biosynthesis cysteine-adding enzyme BshC [Pyrinomonadaceae bacterium]
VCPCPSEKEISVESLSFAKIPHQSRLFIEYQQNPLGLSKYYPNAIESHTQISNKIPQVLQNYKVDRNELCDVLLDMNGGSCSGSEKTLENIKLLRESDTVAVVSGQQAGLFTGPLYTIYKALSAVKLTECLKGRGFKAVPVFWIATEDHDFIEVSNTFIINKNGNLAEIKNEPKRCYDNLPVGYVKLDDSIKQTINGLFNELPHTEFTDELREMIETSWVSGQDYGDAFARMLTKIIGKYGIILLCPLDERLKKLATPVYVEAIKKSDEIVSALRKRSEELVSEGYHAQVLINEDYFPLFYQAKNRTRHALKKTAEGTYKTKGIEREFTLNELAELAENEPHRFSPSVVLRSVVQDYLLPTICYFGGAAEIAYFAQSGEVYRILDRPITTIFHRQSFSFIESRHAKTLQRFNLTLQDLFQGEENLIPEIVEKYLASDTAKVFADVEETINAELNKLEKSLFSIDQTLGENSVHRRQKILYHISAMRKKFHKAQIRQDETIKRQIETAFVSLMPHKHLQERTLNIAAILNKYGTYAIDWIYDSIDLDDKEHRIIYL